MKLDGKVALITGAASGIGHEIAKRYVAAGGRVVIADLNEDGAVAAAKHWRRQGTPSASAWTSRRKTRSMTAWPARSKRSARSISWSRTLASRSFTRSRSCPFADWKKMLAIHLDGAFLTTKACVKHMYKQNRRRAHLYGLGA